MEGYDAKFSPALDKRLECPICLLAQREPMQTPCGHRFCSACILRALRETGPRCPVDNTRVAVHQLFKDNFAKREVLSLHVHCHAKEHGCDWEGELRNLEQHDKFCELAAINCPNECGHSCQRKDLLGHLPSCYNHLISCLTCCVLYTRNKISEHSPFCSKIKLPSSVLESISKANEIIKWCGHLKMKTHGQNYSATGYLTASLDSEERFIHSGCWSSNINLIPLMGPASKIFWRTLQGPEVKPVELYFDIYNCDSKSTNFQKMLKKKINAVVGLRLKPSSRRELMILYIHWSEPHKRLIACVAELRNYLVREMQSKLQQLKRTSQYEGLTELSHHETRPRRTSGASERGGPSRRGYGGSVRLINVPPTIPAASVENHSHLPPVSHVVPSVLSWQLSPNFPAYPWGVQAAGPGVPFFTIPSTPPQFLPAHSYPYTFAPMPAIAAPPFSINPIQQVPASITIPSYAGVTVPRVSGLHAEVVVSSSSSVQGPQSYVEGSGNNPIPHIPTAAIIHPYPPTAQDPLAVLGPTHSVNQVSVVVDPRLNPSNIIPPGGISRDNHRREVRPSPQEPLGHSRWRHRGSNMDHWIMEHPHENPQVTSSREHSMESTPSPTESLFQTIMSDNQRVQQISEQPGPSRLPQPHPTTTSPSSLNSPLSLYSNVGPILENSDDDSDIVDSPLHWSTMPTQLTVPPHHHIHYINHQNEYPSSDSSNSGTPGTVSSGDEGMQSALTNQQRAIGSALQTLADAAVYLTSSPQSDSNSSDDLDLSIISNQSPSLHSVSHTNATNTVSMTTTDPRLGSFSRDELLTDRNVPVPSSSSLTPSLRPSTSSQHSNVIGIQQPQPSVYNRYQGPIPGFEEIPVFVPVIHPSIEQIENEHPIGVQPTVEGHPVLYAPREGGVVVTSRPLPIAEVPPLIRVAQGSRNVMSVSDPWPIVEQRPTPSGFIRPQPIVAAPSGGFWEEVMPSLDMRLHESHP